MATGAESLQLFNQLVANANSLFLSDEDFVVINGVTKPTLRKIYAEFLASLGTYPTVADGIAGTSGTGTQNRFFTVPGSDGTYEIRYRNDSGTAFEVGRVTSSSVINNLTSLMVNQAKVYPSRATTRNNITSGQDNQGFHLNALLDVRIIGARPGYYYKIGYFKNGASVAGPSRDSWIIYEIASANFETADNPATTILNYTEPAPDIPRTGIQTVKLDCPRFPSIKIYITVDSTKLPALGTPVNMQRTFDGGYSWIIDPSRYTYQETSDLATSSAGAYWSMTGSNVEVAWKSGGMVYKMSFGPNGFNDLPNIIGLFRGAGTDPKNASWTAISSSATDWLPPLVVAAVANGDAGATAIYTGGNHGSNGSAGGTKTARNIHYRVMADGQPVSADGAGWAECLSIMVVNEVMAYNTILSGRYVVREVFNVQIRAGALEITCDRRAIEAISVEQDNGPQTVTVGFQGTQLFYGGTNTARVAFDPTAGSGNKSVAPDAWAVVFQDATNGQLTAWMDREYGVGPGANVASNRMLIRLGGASNTKAYHTAISGVNLSVAAGQSYKWRGGYTLQAPGLQAAGLDSYFNHYRAGRQVMSYAMPDAKWVSA